MKTSILLYHGSSVPVEHPEIRKSVYTKDFSWGFYCTKSIVQAKRWAIRNTGKGCLNIYRYQKEDTLHLLKFDEVNASWLDFIAQCRSGHHHNYDIVEGPMADDSIWKFWECLDFCVQGGFQGGSQSRLPFVYRGLKINDQRLRGTLSRRHKCAKRGECGAPSGGFHHTLHHSIALVNRSPNSRANCGMADDHLVLARVQVSV